MTREVIGAVYIFGLVVMMTAYNHIMENDNKLKISPFELVGVSVIWPITGPLLLLFLGWRYMENIPDD